MSTLEAIQQNNTLIVVKAGGFELRFLILTAPSPSNLSLYIKDSNGWFFEDGAPPPKEVLSNWINLLEKEFGINNQVIEVDAAADGPVPSPDPDDTKRCVGVHCIAGLGRAPVLVAVALIELAGLPASDAVSHIREARNQGCFNQEQLKWLLKYKRMRKPKKSGKSECCCVQ
eukprot:TRINITY_DN1957_c1_g1_i2.p1 TRINITY_DN1957_c1_g1~~TRINITY_DN1957_c1_g1_i2.p1  ORF type:complete len:172 (+),score=23.08 TRINITY_DN1957_c1_g1_i2:79-594(+)